jgi:hypothetical protein
MKSIDDIITEAQRTEKVYLVKGPDGSIAGVWNNEEDSNSEASQMNKEVQGNNLFTIEFDDAKNYINNI